MDKKENIDLASYRLERAKEENRIAKSLAKDKYFLAANNRAYYSIFYAVRAVLAMERVDFKKHKDVTAYFNQHYVKTEIFPKALGRKIIIASKVREDSDYDDGFVQSAEITYEQIETSNQLIKLVEEYLSKNS